MPCNGPLQWDVIYKSGKLETIGFEKVKIIQTLVEITTVPYQIVLNSDRKTITAYSSDVSVINVILHDKQGGEFPETMNKIQFQLKGNTNILGVGNGDSSSYEDDKCLSRNRKRSMLIVNAKSFCNIWLK